MILDEDGPKPWQNAFGRDSGVVVQGPQSAMVPSFTPRPEWASGWPAVQRAQCSRERFGTADSGRHLIATGNPSTLAHRSNRPSWSAIR